MFQQDRARPRPLLHQTEELGDNGRAVCERVKLADASHHDGPRNAAGVAEDGAIDAPFVGPKLDGAKSMAEAAGMRDGSEELLGYTRAVDAAHGLLCKAVQVLLLNRVHVPRDGRELGQRCEDQVDAYAAILHLDDRYESVFDGVQLGDVLGLGHFTEDGGEVAEEVVDADLLRYDDQRVDVRGGTVDAEGVASKGEDLAAGHIDGSLLDAFLPADAADELLDDRLQVSDNIVSAAAG